MPCKGNSRRCAVKPPNRASRRRCTDLNSSSANSRPSLPARGRYRSYRRAALGMVRARLATVRKRDYFKRELLAAQKADLAFAHQIDRFLTDARDGARGN